MMKSEKALGQQLKLVAKECQSEDIAKQLKKLGSAFLGNRVVGGLESAMKVNSMWLIRKSRKVIFVFTDYREGRVSIPKSKDKLKEMDDDDDENIFMTNIHDRYAARPNDKEAMCLAKFAVSYDVLYSYNKDENNNIISDNEDDNDADHEGIDVGDNIQNVGGRGKQEVICLNKEAIGLRAQLSM